MGDLRLTTTTQAVLEYFLSVEGRQHGYLVITRTGLRDGTVYPILKRLQEEGILAGNWEGPREHEQRGEARRYYYILTSSGRSRAEMMLQEAYNSGRRVLIPWGSHR